MRDIVYHCKSVRPSDRRVCAKNGRILLYVSLFCFFLWTLVFSLSIANAIPVAGIVATVNNKAISAKDLDARIRLVITASGMPNTEETKLRIAPQVLRSLIDEQLKLGAAEENDITVDADDIEKQFERVAAKNKMTVAEFEAAMRKDRVPPETLKEQIKADIAWARYVQRILRPKLSVSFEEVDKAANSIRATQGLKEFRVAEIYLEVSKPDQEKEAEATAKKIIQDLEKGAPFPILARQFSQSAGAVNGGDMGWVLEGQLQEALNDALLSLEKGKLSQPIRSALGYHILLKLDERKVTGIAEDQMTLDIKQVFIPMAQDGALESAKKISKSVSGCLDMDKAMGQNTSELTGSAKNLKISDIDPAMSTTLRNLEVGKASPPIKTGDGYSVVMVCRKNLPDTASTPSLEDLFTQISNEKLDRAQRHSLRDLRQNAYIEMRLM